MARPTIAAGCEAITSAKALQTLERYMYKTCKSKKILKPTRRITNHTHGSSLRCRFFMAPLARSSSRCILRRSFLAAALPPLAIYRQRVSWYNLLGRKLVTHLRDTAQSNNIASKFGDPRGSDPPSNSRHHPKRQNLHPHCYQRHSRA